MNIGKSLKLGVVVLAGALAAWAASCGGDDGPGCNVGSEACSCTSAGVCDPGLSCVSMKCVKPGTTGGTGGATATGGTGGSAATGGTGGGAADMAPVTDPATICMGVQKLCEKLQECAPFLVSVEFGTVAKCTERLKLSCVDGVMAPGSGLTGAAMDACTAALATATCEDIIYRKVAACTFKGSRANGMACGSGEQCTSGHCAQSGSGCGVCAGNVADGAMCTEDEDCAPGRICNDEDRCVLPSAAGTACNDNQPCAYGAYCANMSCRAGAAMAGGACTAGAGCSILHAAYCSTSNVCAAIPFGGPGAACGITATSISLCAAGSCIFAPMATTGVCATHGGDGDACGAQTDNDKSCQAPAQCIAGRCKLPNSAACN